MTILGRLLRTCPLLTYLLTLMLKAFSSENFEVPSKKGPKMAVLGQKGV